MIDIFDDGYEFATAISFFEEEQSKDYSKGPLEVEDYLPRTDLNQLEQIDDYKENEKEMAVDTVSKGGSDPKTQKMGGLNKRGPSPNKQHSSKSSQKTVSTKSSKKQQETADILKKMCDASDSVLAYTEVSPSWSSLSDEQREQCNDVLKFRVYEDCLEELKASNYQPKKLNEDDFKKLSEIKKHSNKSQRKKNQETQS